MGQTGAASAVSTPGGPMYIPDDSSELVRTHDLRTLIRETVVETAAQGDVVIVAHAASFALGDRDDVLRVLITAPTEVRTTRLAEARGVEASEATKELKRSDDARASYLKGFYGIDRELPTHYDLVVNTDRLDAREAAEIIIHAAGA
jgi:cytidylate kinase